MENEIGEYGRTNLGKIIKFAWLEDEKGKKYKNKVILVDLMLKETYPYYYFKKGEYIVKHSPNLIDLIEIGDLVKIEDNCGVIHWFEVYENSEIYQYEILEIVTKEMMESISYKVTKM